MQSSINFAILLVFIHLPPPYTLDVNQSDVAFVGANKGRESVIKSVYQKLISLKVKSDFTVIGMSEPIEGISTERLTYQECLQHEWQSRCILEICSEGQTALTQRSLEAIMYNKYLITNNPRIKECKYYDPEKILVINSPQDITQSFVDKLKNDIDYHYKGDFSLARLLENIENQLP